MSDLRELYQEIILDHYKNPRHFGAPESEDALSKVEGYNPLCGDKITLWVGRLDGRVHSVHFQGEGCAISTASASLMSEAMEGRTEEEARSLWKRFHGLLTGTEDMPLEDEGTFEGELGKLEALLGVREYPVRIKCATLAWHAFESALSDGETVVSTE